MISLKTSVWISDIKHFITHQQLLLPPMFPGFSALHLKKNEVSELLSHPMYKLRKTPEAVSKTANPNLKIKLQPSL